MIIRFPKIDKQMSDLLGDLVFRYSHSFDPIFSDIGTYIVHEGKTTSTAEGGEVTETKMFQASAETEISFAKFENYDWEDFDHFARTIAKQFLDEKKKKLFEMMSEVTEKTGNIIDSKGKPFNHETFFEAIEMIQIDFDDKGQPEMPSMMIHPNMAPLIERLSREAEEDPLLKKRHEELMRQKKEQFRAREADRRLVG